MRPAIDLTMLVLSAIWVAEADGSPMTAQGDGAQSRRARRSVRVEGDLYHMSRSLTDAQLAKKEHLSDRIRELCPNVDEIPVRLDS